MAWIYVLKNKINGKMYVGQTINIKERLRKHKLASRKQAISSAIKKYGWDNFDKFIFEIPEDCLDYFEVELIKNLNTLSPKGYNLNSGGHKNKHFSEESIKNMSDSHKGKFLSDTTKKKLSVLNKGKTFSEETRRKIGIKHKGKIVSEDARKKMSEAHKGKSTGSKGIKLPERSGINHFASKKVFCIETQKIYVSITEAEIKTGINHSCIADCCKGKQKTAGKLHWIYYENYLKQQQDNSQGVA